MANIICDPELSLPARGRGGDLRCQGETAKLCRRRYESPRERPIRNIAPLIDADNAPARKIDFIIAELARSGVVNIRRAYGNWSGEKLTSWVKLLHEYAIQPVQQFDLVKGKNATDMAMLIDALDILYTKNVTTFCLVSSDCDFTPLVRRLREDGKRVSARVREDLGDVVR